MARHHLKDRAVLTVSGVEAEEFLGNLITCALPPKNKLHSGALLTPQGKILFEFCILGLEDGYQLDCLASQRDELLKRLMFYRLRAKVDLAPSDLSVFSSFVETGEGYADPRHADLGWRIYGRPTEADGDDAGYHVRRITVGIAELGQDFEPESTFPHETSMDFTGGVDFQKGCYVGQEVVSRMQHRGTARSRFLIVNGDTQPRVGTALLAGDRTIGTMGSSVENKGLALMRLDRLSKALAEKTSVTTEDGQPVTFSTPSLEGFPWPA
ncbi:MAG: folate-binding protein [Pseudomonadota bacterium]